jgi:hypothetical protein
MAEVPTQAPSIEALVDSSDLGLPVIVRPGRTPPVKIINSCGMTCTFCHNEGTPVTADNVGGIAAGMSSSGRTGRRSIYMATNGVRFLPAAVAPDGEFQTALTTLRDALGLDEFHLTGGEPSLHPRLADLIRVGHDAGFRTAPAEYEAKVLPPTPPGPGTYTSYPGPLRRHQPQPLLPARRRHDGHLVTTSDS